MKEGMKVDLPEVQARALETQDQDLVITVRKDKTVDINGSPVDLPRLDMILDQIRQQRRIESVFLQADASISYGYVVEVMALIRSTGLTKIGLVTQPPSKK